MNSPSSLRHSNESTTGPDSRADVNLYCVNMRGVWDIHSLSNLLGSVRLYARIPHTCQHRVNVNAHSNNLISFVRRYPGFGVISKMGTNLFSYQPNSCGSPTVNDTSTCINL